MKALAVVLRFTEPEVERWRVPFNIRFRGVDIPIGLSAITLMLFLLAGINVLTKTKATLSGVLFTIVFFTALTLSERYHKAHKKARKRPAPVVAATTPKRARKAKRKSSVWKSGKTSPPNHSASGPATSWWASTIRTT